MKEFLFGSSPDTGIDPVLKAGLAHLWFVTIHAFDDATAAPVLQHVGTDPAGAESVLRHSEHTQNRTMDITPWMDWFLGCLGRAIDGAQTALSAVLAKARFWERVQGVTLNDRQKLVLHRLLEDFKEKLTTSKYAKLASARRTQRSAIFFRSSTKAFLFATRNAAEALAIR